MALDWAIDGISRSEGRLGESVARRTSTGGLLIRRWAGAWIDFMALGLVFFLPGFLIGRFLPASELMVWVGLLLVALYFPLTEGLWGRSVGKLIAGTIVVDRAGRTAGLGPAVVRTLFRVVEVNPFFLGGLPAGLVAGNTKANQRIGDLLAKTYVVPVKELKAAQASTGEGVARVFT